MLVAVAMFTFTACDNTADMSDAELEQAIIKHSESGGKNLAGLRCQETRLHEYFPGGLCFLRRQRVQ